MSMMHCNGCDNYIDTDFDVEGVWEDRAPHRFWCGSCVDSGSDAAMCDALLRQDPQAYEDLFGDEQ